MFDFDASKLLIIGVVALIVIGPKDLPRVLRQVGQMVGKLRRMAADFQGQFMDAMKEADLADLRTEVNKLRNTATLDVDFDPVRDVRATMSAAVAAPAPPSAAVEPAPAMAPALEAAVLEPVEAAHHTPAAAAGAIHAVEAGAGPGARRRILVPKRRPPGDRLARTAPAGRGRPFFPPRRDPRP